MNKAPIALAREAAHSKVAGQTPRGPQGDHSERGWRPYVLAMCSTHEGWDRPRLCVCCTRGAASQALGHLSPASSWKESHLQLQMWMLLPKVRSVCLRRLRTSCTRAANLEWIHNLHGCVCTWLPPSLRGGRRGRFHPLSRGERSERCRRCLTPRGTKR